MDLLQIGLILLAFSLILFILVRYTPIFQPKPGQEINLGKLFKDGFQYLLAALITAGFFLMLWTLATKPIPVDNQKELDIVLGALVSVFTGLAGYFFGSSKGSSEKNDIIASAIPDPNAPDKPE